MKYNELMENAHTKFVSLSGMLENDLPVKIKGDPEAMKKLNFLIGKNHVKNQQLSKFIALADQAELKIKKAKMANLKGSELKKIRESERQKLLHRLENERKESIFSLIEKLSKKESEYKIKKRMAGAQELYQLEMAKLEIIHIDESQAMAEMSAMQRAGKYDIHKLLVLGSVSNKTHEKALKVREEIPPFMANDLESREMLKNLESLVDLHIGEISYSVADSPAINKINVGSFISDPSPTVADFNRMNNPPEIPSFSG